MARGSGRGDRSGCVGAGAGLGPRRWPVRRREGAGPTRGRGRGLALRPSGARARESGKVRGHEMGLEA